MKLKKRTLNDIAEMICGAHGTGGDYEWRNFVYRTSSRLTRFFMNCDTDYVHTGSRHGWVVETLEKVNEGPASDARLPSDVMIRVIQELLDRATLVKAEKDPDAALQDLNKVLARENLEAYFDGSGLTHLRAGSLSSAALPIQHRAFTQKDLERRQAWAKYLGLASEDDFTEKVLIPLFQQCAFVRISAAGHKDKALEFGKDIWMKFRLPTSHFIYFGVQVKKGKIDAAGRGKGSNENVSEVLNQVRMALDHPILDPEINKQVLVDHVYVVATGEITKQAKQFLAQKLDQEGRRHIIFMDRDDILNLLALISMPLPGAAPSSDDEIPF